MTAPEIAGAEQVGMIGIRYRGAEHAWLSLGVTYDNTQAIRLRPGVTVELPVAREQDRRACRGAPDLFVGCTP